MASRQERNRAIAVRWFQEVWNERRLETIDELAAEDAVSYLEGMPPATKDDIREFTSAMHQAVPDLHVELIDVVTHGEFVSVEWRFTGTHEAPLFGIPPSGQAIEERGFTKIRVRGDEIIEGRDYWNLGAMLDRLSRPSAAQVAREHSLTPRQAEVALLLADGASAKRIARALRIAVNTARRHTQAVLRRLGVHDRREVAHRIGRASIAVSGPHSPTSSDTSKPGTECDRD